MNAEGMRLFTLAFVADVCRATTNEERLSIVANFLFLIDEGDLVFYLLSNGVDLKNLAQAIDNELGGATMQTYIDTKRKAGNEKSSIVG